jgi:cell division cycle protein 20 (cofactor of APC complex)
VLILSSQRGDRFIPNRELSRSQGGSHDSLLDNTGGETLHSAHASSSASSTCDDVSLSQSIAAANQIPTDVAGAGAELPSFDDGGVPQQRILSFSAAAPPSLSQPDVRARYAATRAKAALPSSLLAGGRRKIQTHAIKTLDAVAVAPDFYRNTLHWSSRNVLAVSLAECVHLWNGDTGEVEMLLDLQEQSERFGGGAHGAITSLRWNGDGQSLAVGTASGHMQIWDAASKQRLRTLRPSAEGGADCVDVNACAWGDEGMLSLGFASGLIREHDVRVRESVVRELPNAHAGAVCGLAWRRDGVLLASGGNDNVVQVWDRRSDAPRLRKNVHSAAVKVSSGAVAPAVDPRS